MSSLPFFVSGLINVENTLRVRGFPLEYYPVDYPFFGIKSAVAGVGYNVSKALTTLGADVSLASMVADDFSGDFVRREMRRLELNEGLIEYTLSETPQSIILYDETGRRQIHVDLKDAQDHRIAINDPIQRALKGAELAIICNVNFARPLLAEAKAAGKMIATDVHAIERLDDEYNQDYMRHADILFFSHERIFGDVEAFALDVMDRYQNKIIVVGMGSEGALMLLNDHDFVGHFPAFETRPIINTIGAGDALFSAFVYFLMVDHDPRVALKKAQLFASWKIGEKVASEGYLIADEVNELYQKGAAPFRRR